MAVRLIADDAGAVPAIDAAIDDLIDMNVLDGVAVFANFGGLLRCQTWQGRGVSVGIHLNLSTGPPLLPAERVRSLLGPSGDFNDPRDHAGSDAARLLESYRSTQEGRIDPVELVDEFHAQVDFFEAALEHRPDFVSVHHDLDAIDVVRDAADSVVPNEKCRRSRLENGSVSVYEYELHSGNSTVADIRDYLCEMLLMVDARSRVELICHPARSLVGLDAMTIYNNQRVIEYQALQTPQVRQALSRARNSR